MRLIPPKILEIDEDVLADIDERVRSIYRLIVFDKNHKNADILERYLEAMEHLKDVLSIKNAQQEAHSHAEAVLYLEQLKHGLTLIVEEIAAQRVVNRPADLFMLMRAIAPEALERVPNHFRQTSVQFGKCSGADPLEIPHLVEQLFLSIAEIKHPVVKAMYLHHELVRIHPFIDGNGRLSRVAKNWLLMYDLYPPMFINNYADKQKYIAKLEGSFLSIEESPDVFSDDSREFFRDEMIRLRASTGFVLDRMLRDPDRLFDGTGGDADG